MSEDTTAIDGKTKPKGNGKLQLLTLKDLDGRTSAAKHALELHRAFLNDLGGEDQASTAQRELCQRAACLGAALEDAEAKLLQGDEVSLADYCTLANAQRRILSDIGLDRRAKDITPAAPTVEAYLKHKREREQEASAE